MTVLQEQLQRTLGPLYTVDQELGGGGMSRVLLAHDAALDRRVVVKVLRPELAATVSVDRFRREIMLVATLQHPHIVGILSAGQITADGPDAGLPFFVMPFVEGESLRARLARGPLSVVEAVRIMRDVARALAYAHERGVIHRDVKPDNILLSGGSAVVTDFGVAKAIQTAREKGEGRGEKASGQSSFSRLPPPSSLTELGITLGTPTYMAPEQAAADPATDHRADLYSFGITAYEMLAGAPPFGGGSPQALLTAQLAEAPTPLGTRRANIPAALADVVMRCLEKDPARRPQSAAEVVAALEDPAVLSGAFVPTPSAAEQTAARVAVGRGHTIARVAVGAFVLVAIVVGVWQWRSFGERSVRRTTTPASAVPTSDAGHLTPRSIAVLPFVNIGGDATDSRFADGMTETLTNKLSKVRGVRVASRTAAAAARGQTAGAGDIGKALNVATYLEGTVQREGKRLRLTARLVDANDGFTIWGDVYESEVKDLFAIQDAISAEIVSALGEALGVAPTPGGRGPA